MAIINIELPMLLLLAALLCSAAAWLLSTFTGFLREYRYRVTLGTTSFAVSGLMGFFSALKLEMSLLGDWLSVHPVWVLLAIAYFGYVLFGFLGCWTAVRIAARMDRKHTLSMLYSLVEDRKKRDTEGHSAPK